jgi:hypothetical protein
LTRPRPAAGIPADHDPLHHARPVDKSLGFWRMQDQSNPAAGVAVNSN